MKRLLVYASKYGATKKCMEYVASHLNGEYDLIDLTKEMPKQLEAYGTIILGASVYAGRIRKEAVAFMKQEQLKDKKVILLLSCLTKEQAEQYVEASFGQEQKSRFAKIHMCGGILDLNKMNVIERILIKKIYKSATAKEGKVVLLQNDSIVDQIDYKELDTVIRNS